MTNDAAPPATSRFTARRGAGYAVLGLLIAIVAIVVGRISNEAGVSGAATAVTAVAALALLTGFVLILFGLGVVARDLLRN